MKRNKYNPTAIAGALACACRRRGYAEWLPCVEAVLTEMAHRGIDTAKIEIIDGWGEEYDYPYFWAGNGEFSLYYYSDSQNESERARSEITAVLTDFASKNAIHIEDKGQGGGREPWWWVRANLTQEKQS